MRFPPDQYAGIVVLRLQSITTTPVEDDATRPYDDLMTTDGLLHRYRGRDPQHHDNVGLRLAMRRQRPLVNFHGIVAGQ